MEQQHADRVGDCVLLAPLIDAGNLVDRDFDRSQQRREKRALAGEHMSHVAAEERRRGDNDGAINQNLHPAEDGHGRGLLKTARA